MLEVSKRSKRLFAFLVGFMLIVSQSSYLSLDKVYGQTDKSASDTVYMLTDTLEDGQDYIVASGDNGSVSILERESKEVKSTKANVTSDENGTYINAPSDGAVWTAEKSGKSGAQLVNDDYAVVLDENNALILNQSAEESSVWSYDGDTKYLATGSGDDSSYMIYDKGFEASNDGDEVYLYVETEINSGQDAEANETRGPPAGDVDEDSASKADAEETADGEKAPSAKSAAKGAKAAGTTVLAFSSDVHNKSNNTAAVRMGTMIDVIQSNHGDIDAFGMCGDMGNGSAGESDFYRYTEAVMNAVENKGIEGVYTTGNHEFYNGNFSTTTNAVKNRFIVGDVGKEGDNYIIYCMGTTNWNNSQDNFTTEQITALTNFLNSVGTDKPIFVLVHFPLHRYERRQTTNADRTIDVLNAAANSGKKIVLLWGHNHSSSDTNYDQIFEPGDTITYNSSGNSKEIQFYYGAAGCGSDSEYGTGSAYVKGKALAVTINTKDQLSFTYYDERGNNVTEGGTYTEQDPVAVTGVSINEESATVEVGRRVQLHVTVEPSDATNKSVTWSSSDSSVASVDTNGKVKGVSPGTATITATSNDTTNRATFSDSIEIEVVPRTSVDPNYVISANGYALSTERSTDQVTSGSTWYGGSTYTGMEGVQYSSGDAAEDSIRWVFEETDGGYYIKSLDDLYLNATYTSSGSSWTSSSQGNLKLDDTPDVWVLDNGYTLADGDIDGTKLKSTNADRYLAEETGQAGGHLFTVRSETNADSVAIEAATDPVAVTGITVSPKTATIEARKTQQLTANITPANATSKKVKWTSSNTNVATVNDDGLVRGKSAGEAIITASAGGFSDTCTVTVTPSTSTDPNYVIAIDNIALSTERSPNTANGGSSSYTYTGLAGVAYTSGYRCR